jgi:hypothetical protein
MPDEDGNTGMDNTFRDLPDMVRCKQCNKYLDGYVNHPNEHDSTLCDECWEHNQGLVPCLGHYVPWSYVYWSDTLKRREVAHHEDIHAKLPTISWCEEFKKWKVSFTGADSGGYDVQHFEWYYNSREDIIKEMMHNDDK